MNKEMELRRENIALLRENVNLKEEVEEWKKKAWGIYEEYEFLRNKIVTQGIYFDPRKEEEANIDGTMSS